MSPAFFRSLVAIGMVAIGGAATAASVQDILGRGAPMTLTPHHRGQAAAVSVDAVLGRAGPVLRANTRPTSAASIVQAVSKRFGRA
jgi:hypothetical protein